MSFDLDLWVPIAGWDVAERRALATRDQRFVALVPCRRRHWFRSRGPSVHLDFAEGQAGLDDQASWYEDEFTLSERRHALAETLLLVTRELPGAELGLRCCWIGDEVRSEARMTAAELADHVRRSALKRYVLYRA